MATDRSFEPTYGSRKQVTAAITTANVSIGAGQKTLEVSNLGAEDCYIRLGGSSVVATTLDYLIPGGASTPRKYRITKFQDHTHVAYISATSTSILSFMPGEGF